MIYLGADHAGFALKEHIKLWLTEWNMEYEDLGNTIFDADDDYPDFAFKVAENVTKDPNNRGILTCQSAACMVIAANKVKGIRAVAVFDNFTSEHSREHNDSNIVALPGMHLSEEKTKEILKIWLETPFGNEERHKRRLEKINKFENSCC